MDWFNDEHEGPHDVRYSAIQLSCNIYSTFSLFDSFYCVSSLRYWNISEAHDFWEIKIPKLLMPAKPASYLPHITDVPSSFLIPTISTFRSISVLASEVIHKYTLSSHFSSSSFINIHIRILTVPAFFVHYRTLSIRELLPTNERINQQPCFPK